MSTQLSSSEELCKEILAKILKNQELIEENQELIEKYQQILFQSETESEQYEKKSAA